MRTRTAILPGTVLLSLMAMSISTASAATPPKGSQQAAPLLLNPRSVTGRMLTSPGDGALITRLPLRVALRVPAGTARVRVRVGNRDVTGRVTRAGGALRVALLRRADGIRVGRNQLFVIADRRGAASVTQARTFVLGRSQASLAAVRIRPGAATGVEVRVGGTGFGSSVCPQNGQVGRTFAAARPERAIRVWLNGRLVTRAFGGAPPTRLTTRLSATHGLRYGVNTVRVQVIEPVSGRYTSMSRRFVVRRNRNLASAGWDRSMKVGGSIRLNGGGSRTADRRRVAYRWRIVSKPRGSRARLRDVTARRPLFVTDRAGRYVVGLTVTSRRGTRGATRRISAPGSDRVAVTAGPSSLLIPFTGFVSRGGPGKDGVQVGGSFYPASTQGRFQWLTIDRGTLQPTGAGNTWLDPTASGAHGLDGLTTALCQGGVNQLVILAMSRQSTPPVDTSDQANAFNDVLKQIGVGPIDTTSLTQGNQQLVIMGVPYSGDGAGWYSQRFKNAASVFGGWLMPDAVPEGSGAPRFRFQPERPPFNTRSSSTPTSNTMTVRGTTVTDSLPGGASAGFQVVKIDPLTFTVIDHAAFATNHAGLFGDPLGGRKAMAFFLGQSADAGELVAVQSIGHVTAAPWDGDPDQYKQDMITAWTTITDQIARDGANPNTFYTANGSYAYLGGPRLARSEGQDSSSAVVLDPTTSPPISESGTLHGRVVVGADGMLKPVLTEAGGGGLDLQLYDKLFTAPRPWRCTPPSYGPQPPAADCAAALAYITANVGEFGPGWGNDLRQAYWKNLGIDYGAAKSDLSNLRYPADNRNCNEPKGPHVAPNPGYTRREFCGLVSELQGEFTWMANVNTLFNNYKDALSRSVAQQLIDLKSIGNTIEGDVAPDNAAETTWSVFGFLGNATSAALVFAAATPEGTAALAAWEALVSIYEFIREMISQNQGQPVGDQVASKAQDLASDVASRLGATSDALDRLHQVIASDYGRLSSIGSVASSPAWTVDVPAAKEKLLVAAHQFFYSQLMPIPYGVHDLVGAYPHYDDNPDNCYVYGYGWTFYKAPATAKMKWFGDFNVDGVGGGFPSQFVLGRHSLSVRYYAYPPQSLTDAMFLAPSQQGAGMQLSRYIWNSFDSPHPPTDIAYCH